MLYGYDAGVLGGIQNEPSFLNAIGVSNNQPVIRTLPVEANDQ